MKKKITDIWNRIQAAHAQAKTDEEIAAAIKLQHELQDELTPEELKKFNDLLLSDTHDLVADGDRLIADGIKEKLGELPEAISLAYVAKNYFGKSNSWLSQRINGSIVNGKRARFSSSEVKQLQDALHDLGHRLLAVSF